MMADESPLALKRRARKIVTVLGTTYPDAHCELDFTTPLELLVATVLSAQCTDQRVNAVTPELFRRYPDAASYAAADRAELELLITPTGFFRQKAATVVGIGQQLCDRYGGEVPGRLKDLVTLPGVGRKTANVVLGDAFGVPGIAMGVATLIFWLGSRHYVQVPPNRGANRGRVLAVLVAAWRRRRRRLPGQSFLDGALMECTPAEVDGVKALGGILAVFASAPIFWALYDQQNSTWVIQGGKMTAVSLFQFHLDPQTWRFVIPFLKLFFSEASPGALSFTLDSERMQTFNPLFVMILIPAFTAWLYPLSERLGFKATALRRMSVGMVLAALSFVACGWLQVRMDGGEKLSILWQVVPFLVVTAGEVLVSATALEFAFSQAPPSMKSLIMSLWMLTIATGNALVAVFASLSEKVVHATEAGAFFFYAALMALVSVIFMLCAWRYQERPLA